MGFLSHKKLNLRGFQRQEVTGARLAVVAAGSNGEARVLGELDGVSHRKLRLGAYTGATTGEVGDLTLRGAVPRRTLYKLGDALRSGLKKQGRTVKIVRRVKQRVKAPRRAATLKVGRK